jgi:hypothetical protein
LTLGLTGPNGGWPQTPHSAWPGGVRASLTCIPGSPNPTSVAAALGSDPLRQPRRGSAELRLLVDRPAALIGRPDVHQDRRGSPAAAACRGPRQERSPGCPTSLPADHSRFSQGARPVFQTPLEPRSHSGLASRVRPLAACVRDARASLASMYSRGVVCGSRCGSHCGSDCGSNCGSHP